MTYGSEGILPYNHDENKSVQVEYMFDSIAGMYDRLNHILSLGIDKKWRKRGIAYLKQYSPKNILDIATGTGDLAISMYEQLKPDQVVGVDISEGMMDIGRRKIQLAGYDGNILFEQQNSMSLTYGNDSFDAVTAAFGVRNFESIEKGIAEMYRVLKPGGHLMILELSTPQVFPVKQLYKIYSKTVIPGVGRILSKEKRAYHYLPASIKEVPQGKVMVDLLYKQGFSKAKARTLTFGVCSMYTAKKG